MQFRCIDLRSIGAPRQKSMINFFCAIYPFELQCEARNHSQNVIYWSIIQKTCFLAEKIQRLKGEFTNQTLCQCSRHRCLGTQQNANARRISGLMSEFGRRHKSDEEGHLHGLSQDILPTLTTYHLFTGAGHIITECGVWKLLSRISRIMSRFYISNKSHQIFG